MESRRRVQTEGSILWNKRGSSRLICLGSFAKVGSQSKRREKKTRETTPELISRNAGAQAFDDNATHNGSAARGG